MDEPEIPFPKKDDVLFAGDRTAWRMDAMLDPRSDSYAYRQGYRRAGRILSEYAAERGEVDFLVFPICHAYRHFVELSLKGLILLGCNLIERDMTPHEQVLQRGSHNLESLWNAFKAVCIDIEKATGLTPPPPEQMEGIEAYISQIHAVDKGSFSFRYPLAKDGAANLAGIDRINLGTFSDCMESLCNYLDGWESYFADTIQNAAQMWADAAGDIYGGSEY